MSTDALELALALHQAPLQRFALRDRPLPENIGAVLQLASGTQPQLQEAAAQFSESEDTVLEAVRFFLHQVLFEPGTDAYRILGLPANADSNLIRQHHAWLQRWLHPDRRGEDWEAVFTTKVNWAWQQLRNESAREEYDRERRNAPRPQVASEAVPAAMPMPAWNAATLPARRPHWPRRIAFVALLALCGGLFYLAATRDDIIDRDMTVLPAENSDAAVAEKVRETRDFPRDTVVAGSMVNDDGAADPQPLESMSPTALADDPQDDVSPAMASADDSDPGLPEVPDDSRVAVATAGTPARSRNVPSSAIPALHIGADAGASDAAASGSTPLQRDQPGAIATRRTSPPAVAEVTRPRTRARATTTSTSALPEDSPSRDLAAQEPAPPQALQPDDSAAPESVDSEIDTLHRFELARERLRSMVAYLRSPDIEVVDWNDDRGRLTVKRERDALHARNGEVEIDRFALDPPTWRVSDANVELEATYHADAGRSVAESGRLYLDMAWRDGSWKITRVKVLPSQ